MKLGNVEGNAEEVEEIKRWNWGVTYAYEFAGLRLSTANIDS